jgi:acylphosphatase
MKMPVKRVTFEVFGRVQGVNFRACTAREAKKVGAVGWCQNTPTGTVTGEVQGSEVSRDHSSAYLLDAPRL